MDGSTTTAGSHHFIGNRWAPSSSGQTIDVIDPSDGAPFAIVKVKTENKENPHRSIGRVIMDSFVKE